MSESGPAHVASVPAATAGATPPLPPNFVHSIDKFCDPGSSENDGQFSFISSVVPSSLPLQSLLHPHMRPYLTASESLVRQRAALLLARLLAEGSPMMVGGLSSPPVAGAQTTVPAAASPAAGLSVASAGPGAGASAGTAGLFVSAPSTTTPRKTSTPNDASRKTASELVAFFASRLHDFPSVHPSLMALSSLLDRHGDHLHDGAVTDVCAALFQDVHVPSLELRLRLAALNLLVFIAKSPRWSKVVETLGFARKFVIGFVQAMDGEKDPRCLLVALRGAALCGEKFLPQFVGDGAASSAPVGVTTVPAGTATSGDTDGGPMADLTSAEVVEELFDVTACYFPISFTPPPGDPNGITKPVLVNALRRVFASSAFLAPHVIPLLLEKLSSTIVSAKVDALETLCAVTPVYGWNGLSRNLRDTCDALRAEIVHGSDSDVTAAALLAVRTLGRVMSQGSTVETQQPAWSDLHKAIVAVSVSEISRSPDSLVGRASVDVLAAVAGGSGVALYHVLAAVLPSLLSTFESSSADAHDTREAIVASLAAFTAAIQDDVDYPRGAHPIASFVDQLYTILMSVFTSPGTPERQVSAARGLSNLVSRAPSPVIPGEQVRVVLQHISDGALSTSGLSSVKTACLEGLQAACRRPQLFRLVLPALLSKVVSKSATTSPESSSPSSAAAILRTDEESVAVLETIVSLVTAAKGVPACMDACVVAQEGGAASSTGAPAASDHADVPCLVPGLLVTVASCSGDTSLQRPSSSFLSACETVLRTVLLSCTDKVRRGLRAAIIDMYLPAPPDPSVGHDDPALAGSSTEVCLPSLPSSFDPLGVRSSGADSVAAPVRTTWSSPSSTSTLSLLTVGVACSKDGSPPPRRSELQRALLKYLVRARDATVSAPVAGAAGGAVGSADGSAGAGGDVTAPVSNALSGTRGDADAAVVAVSKSLGSLLNLTPRAEMEGVGARVISDTLLPILNDVGASHCSRNSAIVGICWALKGLLMAGCKGPAVQGATQSLCDRITDPVDPLAGSVAAGCGVVLLLSDDCLNEACGAICHPFFRQRFFSQVFAKLVNGRVPGSLPSSVLVAVCSMAAQLPSAVLLNDVGRILPLVLVSLKASDDTTLRIKALGTFQVLVRHAVSSVLPHLDTVTPLLLDLAQFKPRATVRAAALVCLREFTKVPYHKIHSLRSPVVRGLAPVLDDPKRAVRRLAAACRNDWITLSTNPV